MLSGTAALALAPGGVSRAQVGSDSDIALSEERGRFLVDVEVNAGDGYRFVLDTGASAHFISTRLVQRLALPRVSSSNVRGHQGRDPATVVRLARMAVGGYAVRSARAIAWSPEALEGHDGLIGYPILGPQALIDLRGRKLVLGASPPQGAIEAPAEVSSRQTLLIGGVPGAEGRFVFDTGSSGCVVSRAYFERLRETEAYRDAQKVMTADDQHQLRLTGFRPAELRFGDIVLLNPIVTVAARSVSDEVFHGVDALFGNRVLRGFAWWIDQERATLHAQPYV
jgi:predicted aspartyl protease